jgi:hypothetical protein
MSGSGHRTGWYAEQHGRHEIGEGGRGNPAGRMSQRPRGPADSQPLQEASGKREGGRGSEDPECSP